MNSYTVVREYPGSAPLGSVLTDADFVNPHRATQLVDRRYLTKMVGGAGTQPTSDALTEATIRQLSQMVNDVVDVGVLEAALGKEQRDSATKVLKKRIAELENNQ